MCQKKQENLQFTKNWLNITPIEFERVLKLYGMQYKVYSNLRGKCHSWFYSVLRKKKHLSLLDVRALTENIGEETFNYLLQKVREQQNKKME